MPTAKEYRERAHLCLELANTATEQYAKQELTELAEEFEQAAEKVEREKSEETSSHRHRNVSPIRPPTNQGTLPKRNGYRAYPRMRCVRFLQL